MFMTNLLLLDCGPTDVGPRLWTGGRAVRRDQMRRTHGLAQLEPAGVESASSAVGVVVLEPPPGRHLTTAADELPSDLDIPPRAGALDMELLDGSDPAHPTLTAVRAGSGETDPAGFGLGCPSRERDGRTGERHYGSGSELAHVRTSLPRSTVAPPGQHVEVPVSGSCGFLESAGHNRIVERHPSQGEDE